MTSNTEPASQAVICFGHFRLDLDGPRLYRKADPVRLGAKALATLAFLAAQRPRIVSKNELLERVWGGQRSINAVEQVVRQLREALGDSAAKPAYIETVPGEGYRFVAALADAPPEPAPEAPPEPSLPTAAANVPHTRWMIRIKWVLSAIGAGLVIVSAIWYLRRPAPTVARVAITRNAAIATDDLGNVLWKYPFPAPVSEPSSFDLKWRSQIVDLDGDGLPKILLVTELESSQEELVGAELLCLSSRGKLVWRYRPSIHMEFRTRDLNGPWYITQVLAVPENHGKSVWVAVCHTRWWPAFIARLSPAGSSDIVFTSSGVIRTLYLTGANSGSYVLADGINNEYRQAFLAVLATGGSPSTSPQTEGAEYQCVSGCPNGRPYRFLLLPRSELNRASVRPYNEAHGIISRPGGITVETEEFFTTAMTTSLLWELSTDLRPERVAYDSSYRDLHRNFEQRGLIHHRLEDCPEPRTPALVAVFDENGVRRTVPVPWVR